MSEDKFDVLSREDRNKFSVRTFLNGCKLYALKHAAPYAITVLESTGKKGKFNITQYDVNIMLEYVFTDHNGNVRCIMPPICKTIWNCYPDGDPSIPPTKFKLSQRNTVKWLNLICDGTKVYPYADAYNEDIDDAKYLAQDWAEVRERCGIKMNESFLQKLDEEVKKPEVAEKMLKSRLQKYFNGDVDEMMDHIRDIIS